MTVLSMAARGTFALASADVAFFSPPPHRPSRPERRTNGEKGVARTLVRALRRENGNTHRNDRQKGR